MFTRQKYNKKLILQDKNQFKVNIKSTLQIFYKTKIKF